MGNVCVIDRYKIHYLLSSIFGLLNVVIVLILFSLICYFRYELREDRKKEASRTSNYFERLRGEILTDLRKMFPPTDIPLHMLKSKRTQYNNDKASSTSELLNKHHYYDETAYKYPQSLSRDWDSPCSSERLTSVSERDQLKQEMISLLREALQEMQIDKASNTMPLNTAELYQTHLYTQL